VQVPESDCERELGMLFPGYNQDHLYKERAGQKDTEIRREKARAGGCSPYEFAVKACKLCSLVFLSTALARALSCLIFAFSGTFSRMHVGAYVFFKCVYHRLVCFPFRLCAPRGAFVYRKYACLRVRVCLPA